MLLDMNINLIVPPSIRSVHDNLIQNYISTGEKRIFGEDRIVYGIKQDGSAQALLAHIKFNPFSKHGVSFIGVLKKIHNHPQFIFFDRKGIIDGCSSKIFDLIRSKSKTFISKLQLEDYIPDFSASLFNEFKVALPSVIESFSSIDDFNGLELVDNLANKDLTLARTILMDLKLKVPLLSNEIDSTNLTRAIYILDAKLEIETFSNFRFYVLKIFSMRKKVIFDKTVNETHQLKKKFSNPLASARSIVYMLTTRTLATEPESIKLTNQDEGDENLSDMVAKVRPKDLDGIDEAPVSEKESDNYKESINFDKSESGEEEEKLYLHNDETRLETKEKKFKQNGTESVASSKNSFKKYQLKNLRAALMEEYHPPSSLILQKGLLSFVVISLLILFIVQFSTIQVLNDIIKNIDSILLAEERQNSLLDLYVGARLANMLLKGEVSIARHADIGIPNFLGFAFFQMHETASSIISSNNELRGNLTALDLDSIYELYEVNTQLNFSSKFDNIGLDTIVKKNIFDANDEVGWLGLVFPTSFPSDPYNARQNLNFILQNSLNDMVINSQYAAKIISEYNEKSLEENLEMSMKLILMIAVLGILILGISISFNTVSLAWNLSRFFEAFSKIPSHEIESCLFQTKSFEETLVNTQKEFLYKAKPAKEKKKNEKFDYEKKKAEKRKDFQTSGYFFRAIKNSAIFFSMILIFTGVLFAYYSVGVDFEEQTEILSDRFFFAMDDFNNLKIATCGMYEYIDENGSSIILNQPIEKIIDELIKKLGNSDQVFKKFSDDGQNLSPAFVNLLTKNLCGYAVPQFSSLCNQDEEILSNGLIGLKSYYQMTLLEAKAFYQGSNRTYAAKLETFSKPSIKTLERLSIIVTRQAFKAFLKEIKIQLLDDLDLYKSKTLVISIVAAIIYILLPTLIWKPVISKVLNQYNYLKKILIPLPPRLILENRLMITILAKFSPQHLGRRLKNM